MARSSVDLPEPLGPSSAVSEPTGSSRSTSSQGGEVAVVLVGAAHGDRVSHVSVLASSCRSSTGHRAQLSDQHDSATPISSVERRRRRRCCGRRCSASGTSSVRVCDVAGQAGRHHDHRAELAERAGDGQHDAVGQAPADRRQGDPPERLPPLRAQRRGGLLLVGADLVQHRLDLADDERQRDEDARQHHAGQAEDDLEAEVVLDEPPNQPADAPQQDQRDADDDGRHRERQVDDRLQRARGRGTCCAPAPAP